MRTLIRATMLVAVLISGSNFIAQAQKRNNSGIKLSAGAEAGLPLGKLHDRYDWNLGGSIQAEFPVYRDQLFVTANAGYYNLFAKDNIYGRPNHLKDLQMLPAKLGVKYFPVKNFYIQGEAGAAFLLNKSAAGYNKSAAFVYAPQVGYRFALQRKSFIDAGLKWESNSKLSTGSGESSFLGLRVAYGFRM